jgi:Tfp pilus assembly protein PilO
VNRRVIIAAVIASVVVLLGWYFILWSPAKSDLTKAEDRTEAAEQQERSLEQAISRLRSAQRNEPLLRAQLETLRTAIPDVPNLAQFILDTNDAAARSGIDFISIAPSEPRAAAGTPATTTTTRAGNTTTTRRDRPTTSTTVRAVAPAEIAIALQIQGGYFPVLDFLNRLDAMPRLVVIDSINVSVDAATTRLSVALNTRMFTRAVPAGFAGAAATTTTTAAPAGGATTTTAAGGATTTTAAGGATTTTAGAAP